MAPGALLVEHGRAPGRRRLAPFMTATTEMVSEVIESNPCMLVVGVVGGFAPLVYHLLEAVGMRVDLPAERPGAPRYPGAFSAAHHGTPVAPWGYSQRCQGVPCGRGRCTPVTPGGGSGGVTGGVT